MRAARERPVRSERAHGHVTSANRGLGRAFATALADFGVDVVVVGRDEHLDDVAATESPDSSGQRTSVSPGDLANQRDARRIAEEAIARHGRI